MDLDNETVDLITVGQALHWLDVSKFYKEVERVLKKKGILAVYGYGLPVVVCEGNSSLATIVEKVKFFKLFDKFKCR